MPDGERLTSDTATISAVAERAGVSRQTVSNVLNAPARVSPDTAARVVAAIKELGYRPNRIARNLRSRTSRLLGFRIAHGPTDVNTVLDRFLHSLTDAAREAGYHVLLFTPTDPAEEIATYDELIGTGTVDGFVLAETYVGDVRPAWLADRGIPFACFGRPWGHETDGFAWVDVDGASGTAAATDLLAGRGHERIAFLGWPSGSGAGDDRAAGWTRAMLRHGKPTGGLRVASENTVPAAAAATAEALGSSRPPTAVVCASDTLALGARLAAADAGRHLDVIGFDDSPVTAALTPPLSSVRQPIEEVGRTVVRLLVDQLTGRPPDQQGVLLAPHLVVRDAVQPFHGRRSTQ